MEAKEWIEKRYGPSKTEQRVVYIATVPVMNGVAIGLGTSEDDAYYDLLRDLRGGHIPIEVQRP